MENFFDDRVLTSFRAFMTALFVGVIDAFLCLVYNIWYRDTRPYFQSDLINVSYIIFGFIFIFCLIGLIHVGARRIFPTKGPLVYIVLMSSLTAVILYLIHTGIYSKDPVEDHSLRTESTGLVLIAGISSVVLIPLLYRSRVFEKYVVG